MSADKIMGFTPDGTCVRLYPSNGSFYYICPKTGDHIMVIRFRKLTSTYQIIEERKR